MSMTEQGAQTLQSVATQLLQSGVRLTLKVTQVGAASMLQALKEASKVRSTTGQVKLKDLNALGGDVLQQKIDPDVHKFLAKDLKARGVTFSIENAPDGNLYVHFQGKDLHTIEHAVTQTEAQLAKLAPTLQGQEPDANTRTDEPNKTAETPKRNTAENAAPSTTRTAADPTQKPRPTPATKQEMLSRIKDRATRIAKQTARAPKPVRLPSKGAR